MKTPTLITISLSLTLTLSACVANSIGSGASYTATNTDSASYYNLCLRAANTGTESVEDNREFYENCLHHYGLATEDNGGIVKGAGRDTSRIGSAEQRGDNAPKK